MIAYYDNKPSVLEAVGNGSYRYRYEIGQVEAPEGETAQWTCQEVTVWGPLTANKVTEAAITDRWPLSHEQKLLNEYYAAQLGLLEDPQAEAKARAYRQFLEERAALKAQIDNDCKELGI